MVEANRDNNRQYEPEDFDIVVLDTGCIDKDYRLAEPETVFLLENATSRNLKVCIPEIVVLEMVNHFRKDLQAANDSLNKALRSIDRLLARSTSETLSEADLEVLDDRLWTPTMRDTVRT